MKNVEKKELLKILDEIIKNDYLEDLLLLIENGIIDERMCQSRYCKVREELVENGYFVELLINDNDERVRYKAYKWLIENNKLEQQHIDLVVKYDDDIISLLLIENQIVDERMCQSGWSYVRQELSGEGYFTDVLIKDENENVSYLAYKWLIENTKLERKHIDYAIQQDKTRALLLFIENGIIDERMCQSNHYVVREELVKKGYFIDILIKDKEKNIGYQAYDWLIQNNALKQEHINYAIQQDNIGFLLLLTENGIVDERMCQSQHYSVHGELAKNGYFVEILINDNDECVRYKVYEWLLKNKKLEEKHVEVAIKKDEETILVLLIENEIINKRMCQSQHYYVRKELAKNGYFVENLINDNNKYIRDVAYKWLVKNNKLKQEHIDKLLLDKDCEILQSLIDLNYESEIIDKEKISKKIKELQAKKKNNLSLLIHNKNILKNNS